MGLGGGLRTSYQPAEQIEIDLSPLEGTSMVQEEDMYAYGCTCCGVFLDDMHSAHCALRDDEWNPDDRAEHCVSSRLGRQFLTHAQAELSRSIRDGKSQLT
jgi:hypothetical protein